MQRTLSARISRPGIEFASASSLKKKIAHLLIGVGEMGMGFDPDEPTEGAARAIIERILIEQIAGSVRRNVILQRSRIEFLFARRDRDGEEIAACAFADETAQTFEARILSAQDADSDS